VALLGPHLYHLVRMGWMIQGAVVVPGPSLFCRSSRAISRYCAHARRGGGVGL
jgi:hypothetical protein